MEPVAIMLIVSAVVKSALWKEGRQVGAGSPGAVSALSGGRQRGVLFPGGC